MDAGSAVARMILWLMNLDADVELAMPGNGYTPSRKVLAAMVPRARALAADLGRGVDALVIEDGAGPRIVVPAAAGLPEVGALRGRAFCPTPRAIAVFRRLGVEPEPAPAVDVLRRVNSRAFCAELGQTLPGAVFATTLERALDVLREPPPIAKQWRAKRAFGMAGRGQRPIAAGAVSDADREFLRTSVLHGGIQLEPEVDIVRELGIHGTLEAGGRVRLGRVVEQRCDASGQWLESVALGQDLPALRTEAERVAGALHAAGYFGPFGVDAFEHRDGLNLRSEINARYSMGFAASGLL